MQENNDARRLPEPPGRPHRRIAVIGIVAAIAAIGLTAYLWTVVRADEVGDDDIGTETPTTTAGTTEEPSASESPEVVTENLFLVEWPDGNCERLVEHVAPPEQIGPDSPYEYTGDFGVLVASCSFDIEDRFATAQSGEEYFWFGVEVELGSTPIVRSNPDLVRTFTEDPAALDASDWAGFLREEGIHEYVLDCASHDQSCEEGDELPVRAEYFEFWGAYANLSVEFRVNYYNAADPEALPEQAATLYGEVFTFLYDAIPREDD